MKSETFRSLHVPHSPLILFNVWDAGSAKAVAAACARAIATSSWSVANANGFADSEKMTRDFVIETLRRIAASTDLPVTVDLEAGYGSAPSDVGETVRLAIEAGAVGCNLEDSIPSDGALRSTAEQVARLRAAREAANALDKTFFINARTDVFFQTASEEHNETMLAEALERTRAYADAGANGIFMPGLVRAELIRRAAAESPLPLNIMVDDETPALQTLQELGVGRVSYGPLPYFAAMNAVEKEAREIFETQISRV